MIIHHTKYYTKNAITSDHIADAKKQVPTIGVGLIECNFTNNNNYIRLLWYPAKDTYTVQLNEWDGNKFIPKNYEKLDEISAKEKFNELLLADV